MKTVRMIGRRAGAVVLAVMVAVGLMYAGGAVYRAIRADLVTTIYQEKPTESVPGAADFFGQCAAYARAYRLDMESCEPFVDPTWQALTTEADPPLSDWTYNADPEGTFIVTPEGTSIWIPADRRRCPRITTGDMTYGACPTWQE